MIAHNRAYKSTAQIRSMAGGLEPSTYDILPLLTSVLDDGGWHLRSETTMKVKHLLQVRGFDVTSRTLKGPVVTRKIAACLRVLEGEGRLETRGADQHSSLRLLTAGVPKRPVWGGMARRGVKVERIANDRIYKAGDVAWVNVRAPGDGDDKRGGKARPAILVQQREGLDGSAAWAVMGLTTNATFSNGDSREPVRDWAAIGLNGPGFYWGPRMPIVPVYEIGDVIGHICGADAEFLASYTFTKIDTSP